MSWPLVKLGDVAPAKPSKHAFSASDEVWTLNLDQVEPDTGKVLGKVMAPVSEVGTSTHGFDARHVLYSKLRPYLNKVVLPDGRGLATTELVPMLPDPLRIDRKYLAYYLRSQSFVDWVSSQVAGAKMPRVSMQLFWQHEIPLPPLPEQKRIAAILDKADAIRRKRQQAIQLADDFLRAVFLDMFGDPVTNPKGWNVVELSTLVDPDDKLNYGVVQPGDNEGDGVPLVRSGDLSDVTPDVRQLRRVSASIDRKHRKSKLKGNEILIACVGTIGRVGWVSDEMIGWNIARAVTRIPIREGVNREYVYRYLQNPVVQGYFERETRAVAQPTLNVGLIAKTPVALPPHDLQIAFLERYKTIQAYKQHLFLALGGHDELASGLSQKAFAGQM
ncbi:restriction endonuclease subunit S [Halopseudomonas xiamenensis]|uniref:restriction endonuclease subunit S n=1 Tax=Halopseudomonas xiamenensis TaxID=157792 RepID=UPI001629E754|nr:restriction endonuclease subunit S [Halopseudomonas xiamenensis]